MKGVYRLLLFLFSTCSLSAQSNSVDSLKALLGDAEHDSTEVRILIELSQELKAEGESEKALERANEALQISLKNEFQDGKARCFLQLSKLAEGEERLGFADKALKTYQSNNDKKGQSISYKLIGEYFESNGEYQQAFEAYDSSLSLFLSIKDTIGVAYISNRIGRLHVYQANYQKAIEYFEKSRIAYSEADNKIGQSYAFNSLGATYATLGDYEKATVFFKKSLEIKESLKDDEGVANTLNNIGIMYFYWANYEMAIDYFQRSLEMHQELKNDIGIALSLNAIGSVHTDWGNLDKAVEYYQNSLDIYEAIGYKQSMPTTLNNMGVVLLDKEEYKQAQAKFEEAKEISLFLEDKSAIAESTYHLGNLQLAQSNYYKALALFQEALAIQKELKLKPRLAATYSRIGKAHHEAGNISESIDNSLLALELAQSLGRDKVIKTSAGILASAYANKGDYQKAFTYQSLYIQKKDSIFNSETQKKISAVESNLELERKEQEILLQKSELERKDAEIKQQEIRQYSLAGATAGLLFIILIVVIGLYRIRKSSNLISKQKEEIEKSHEELYETLKTIKSQKQEIDALNAVLKRNLDDATDQIVVKDKKLSDYAWYNAHETRAPLARILGLVQLIEMKKYDGENSFLLQQIKESSKELDEIINHMSKAIEKEESES